MHIYYLVDVIDLVRWGTVSEKSKTYFVVYILFKCLI